MERESRPQKISGGELASVGVIGTLLLSAAIATSTHTPEDCLPLHDFSQCNPVELQKTEDTATLAWATMIGGPILSIVGGIIYDEVELRKRNKTKKNSEVQFPTGS